MKTKNFFMLLAAVLLSASAFAQSGNNEPLKGDVNGDGVVDYADIDAVIEIMKNAGGYVDSNYYWYVGQTDPSTITEISDNDIIVDNTSTSPGWRSLGNSVPETIEQQIKGFDKTKEIFAAVPITSGTTLKPVTSDMSTIDTSVGIRSTKKLNSVDYQIYSYGSNGSTRKMMMFAKK